MNVHRKYPIKADVDTRRAFDHVYDLLEQRNGNSESAGISEGQLAHIIAQAREAGRTEATSLIGAFAQPLVGDVSSADPLLTPIGQTAGTVTSVSRVNNANFVTVTITNPSTAPVITVDPSPATGWGAPSGTLARTTFAGYTGQTISAVFVQAEVQQIDDEVKKVSQRLAALITDLLNKELLSS